MLPFQPQDPASAPLCTILYLRNLYTASFIFLCHLESTWGLPMADTSRSSEWQEREARVFLPCSPPALTSCPWQCLHLSRITAPTGKPLLHTLTLTSSSNIISFPHPSSLRGGNSSLLLLVPECLVIFVPVTQPIPQYVVPSLSFLHLNNPLRILYPPWTLTVVEKMMRKRC